MKYSRIKLALALMAALSVPFVTQADSSYNSGSINNTVKTTAVVNGVGTSVSHATGSAYATSGAQTSNTRHINPNNGTSSIAGYTGTETKGLAYNVSTGGGSGSASVNATAVANASSNTGYVATGQSLHLNGSSVSNSGVTVTAGTNQDGFANTKTNGNYYADGFVGNVGTKVDGHVYDNKQSDSEAQSGRVTFTNPVVTNSAVVNASSSTIVNASGSFADPQ